jgi:hypothetical protein
MAKVVGIISRKKASTVEQAKDRVNDLVTEVAGAFAELHDRFLKQDYIFRYTIEETSATTATEVVALKVLPTFPSGLYRVKWYIEAEGDGTRAPIINIYLMGSLEASHRFPVTAATQAYSGFKEMFLQQGTKSFEVRVAATASGGTVTLSSGQLVLERLVA